MISATMLDELKDDELRVVIEESQGLLKRRDEDRKAKANRQVRSSWARNESSGTGFCKASVLQAPQSGPPPSG
jgi:hypothetical protein